MLINILVINLMPYNHVLKNFDIAISYASENKDIAEGIAYGLKKDNVEVFYDGFFPVELWGEDLDIILESIFRDKANFCLILVSKYYIDKYWTTKEKTSAIARQIKENRPYILQLKLDDTTLPEISETIRYLKYEGIEKALTSIKNKLALYKNFDEDISDLNKKELENKIIKEFGDKDDADIGNAIALRESEVNDLNNILNILDNVDEVPENVILDIFKKKRIKKYEVNILLKL